ncbi:MAG: hypothetical protein HZA09_02225 [Nitrospirae bacterium]|nr:hypothetical protein [Nitrospirota bacterium]
MIYYRHCLDLAIELQQVGYKVSNEDIDELLNEAKEIDRKFQRSIFHLPLRLVLDYEKINKLRKRRTFILVNLYLKLLKAGDEDATYKEMVMQTFKKRNFIELNDTLLDLYSKESFILSSSLRSLIPMDVMALAERLYLHMRGLGRRLNREAASEIYG